MISYQVSELVGQSNISPTGGKKLAIALEDTLLEEREIMLDFSGTKYHTSLFFNGLFTELSQKKFDLQKFDILVTLHNLDEQAVNILNRSLKNGIDIQNDPNYRKNLDDAFIEGMSNGE